LLARYKSSSEDFFNSLSRIFPADYAELQKILTSRPPKNTILNQPITEELETEREVMTNVITHSQRDKITSTKERIEGLIRSFQVERDNSIIMEIATEYEKLGEAYQEVYAEVDRAESEIAATMKELREKTAENQTKTALLGKYR
jgi:hypothetical protein